MDQQLEHLRDQLAGRYDLVRKVGSGARAVVFLARDLKHDREVALKVLRPEFAASVGGERFLKEIGIAAKMTHPHILPLYDSGHADGALYYVMPYVEGETLRDRIETQGRLPIADAIQLTRQVADALAYAHRKGVVHRDIKPENILLEDGKAVVADFGIARAIATAEGEAFTATGVAVGTPRYMSPEQSSGERELDGRSDIYSLGCVLFEMLVGHPPFSGRRASEVLAQHLSKAPTSPLTERKEVPVWLDRMVLKMLSKDPGKRFDTAESLSAEIAGHTESEVASITDPWIRWVYGIHKRRRPLLVGALGVALVGVGYWIFRDPTPEGPEVFPTTNVALFPIRDLSKDDHSGLARRFTSILTHHLAKVAAVTLVSPRTIEENLMTGLTRDSIIQAHRLGSLIDGDLTVTEDRIEISMSLDLLGSGEGIVSVGPLIRPRDESPELLRDIGDELAGLVRRRLGVMVTKERLEAGTECAKCLEMYSSASSLRDGARVLVLEGDTASVRSMLAQADSILAEVEAMDRDWIEPSIERAWVEVIRSRAFGRTSTDYDPASCHRGIEHAERALGRYPQDARALEVRGVLRSYLAEASPDPDDRLRFLEEAQGDLEGATAREPNLGGAHSRLSYIYWEGGRFSRAKLEAEQALEADPWNFHDVNIIMRLCQASFDLGDPEEINHWCVEEGRKRFPDRLGFASQELALLAGFKGPTPNVDRAWAVFDTCMGMVSPQRQDAYGALFLMDVAAVAARAGYPDSARAVVGQARALAPSENPLLNIREANVRLQLGERGEAVRLLALYLDARPERKAYTAEDWWFEPLWDEPAFKALVRDPSG